MYSNGNRVPRKHVAHSCTSERGTCYVTFSDRLFYFFPLSSSSRYGSSSTRPFARDRVRKRLIVITAAREGTRLSRGRDRAVGRTYTATTRRRPVYTDNRSFRLAPAGPDGRRRRFFQRRLNVRAKPMFFHIFSFSILTPTGRLDYNSSDLGRGHDQLSS